MSSFLSVSYPFSTVSGSKLVLFYNLNFLKFPVEHLPWTCNLLLRSEVTLSTHDIVISRLHLLPRQHLRLVCQIPNKYTDRMGHWERPRSMAKGRGVAGEVAGQGSSHWV